MQFLRRQDPHTERKAPTSRERTLEQSAAAELVIEELEARLTPDELFRISMGNPGTGSGTVLRHVGWGC
jgi:hypothetical protein